MSQADYVIVVDDDSSIQAVVARALGTPVVPFHTLEGFLSQASRYSPKAVFLDVMLSPDTNGLDIVPKIKAMWPYSPLLVMTSGSPERWIADALEAGADDFVSKPLNPPELMARLNVRLRLLDSLRNVDELRAGDVVFSARHAWMGLGEKKVFLSPVSAIIMKVLFENLDSTVSRETLHRVGWPGVKVSENALDQRILEIRRALSELCTKHELHCVHGSGYCFSEKKPLRRTVSQKE
jgi:DNA-binding response OmpR family regulator